MNAPANLKYTKSDEWFDPASGAAGITDYAQGELGDVIFVELPQTGSKLAQMKPFGTIDAVKTVSDLFAPVSGEVAAVNDTLQKNPALVNQSPYENGWMVRIKMENPTELTNLLSPQDYEKLLGAHA